MKTDGKLLNFNERVYAVVRQIPSGFVLSYGDVARLSGNPRASRAVGYACASPHAPTLPFHRVVFKDGSLSKAFLVNGKNRQYSLLKAEKVAFTKDKRVKMNLFRWKYSQRLEREAFLKEAMLD